MTRTERRLRGAIPLALVAVTRTSSICHGPGLAASALARISASRRAMSVVSAIGYALC